MATVWLAGSARSSLVLFDLTETCTFSATHLEVPVVTDVLALAVELAVEAGK